MPKTPENPFERVNERDIEDALPKLSPDQDQALDRFSAKITPILQSDLPVEEKNRIYTEMMNKTPGAREAVKAAILIAQTQDKTSSA